MELFSLEYALHYITRLSSGNCAPSFILQQQPGWAAVWALPLPALCASRQEKEKKKSPPVNKHRGRNVEMRLKGYSDRLNSFCGLFNTPDPLWAGVKPQTTGSPEQYDLIELSWEI